MEFYDAKDVRDAVSAKLPQIIKDLLPHAKVKGAEARVGSVSGEPGSSMAISLNPIKWGAWYDHSTGNGGDLIDILAELRGFSYPEAIEWLAETYTSCIKQPWQQENVTPQKVIDPQPITAPLTDEVVAYAKEKRGIRKAVLEAYGVMSAAGQPHVAAFPHHQNGHLVKMAFADTEKKEFWAAEGGGGGLFGSEFVTPELTKGSITITEGQWDAMSYAEIGIPAVSIPNGVSNNHWIDEMWEYLQKFHTIRLSYDMDEPGQEALSEVIRRLGVHKCLIVSLPVKDASDALTGGLKEQMIEAVRNAQPPEKTDIVSAKELREVAYDELTVDYSQHGDEFFLPEFKMRIRNHEMTLVYGQNHAGKSQFISNQAAYDASKGVQSAIASFEQKSGVSMASLMRQFTANRDIAHDRSQYDQWYDRIEPYISVYNKVEKPSPEKIIADFTYQYKRKGVTRFYLDNLMTLKVARGDNEAQAEAIDKFRLFVKEYPVHLFFLCHPRKPSREFAGKKSDRTDIRGAAELMDIPENIILIFRNESKKDTIHMMISDKRSAQEIEIFDSTTADGSIVCQKQRLTGDTPQCEVWFHSDTQRFMGYKGIPQPMAPNE